MTPKKIINSQQFREISDHEKAIVYLYLESCPYCKVMSPIFQSTADLEIFEEIAFFMVNGHKVDGTKEKMDVESYPQINIFQNGEAISKIRGVNHELESKIQQAFDCRITRSNETQSRPPEPPLSQIIGPACTGNFTASTNFLFDLFRRRNKDREPGCIIRAVSNDKGLLIGDAAEGSSHFRITISNPFPDELEKVYFSVDFEHIDQSRFETAIFSVSFEEIESRDGSPNVKDEPIRIVDVFPASKDGKSEKELLEEGILTQVNAEDDNTFLSAKTDPATQKVVSTMDINGIGIYSSTARWTFSGDATELDASNKVFLVLPRGTKMVFMKFWAEAVLVRKGGNRAHLKIGSEKDCFGRILAISPVWQ